MDNKNSSTSPSTYHMNGGNGPHSYNQNSTFQKNLVDVAKELIDELINENLDIENPLFDCSNPLRIADLGCSVGPNTFFAVQNIIEAIKLKYAKTNQKNPEFPVFFNDHTGNDFNTLFKSLPGTRQYHAAGVPGSFHGQLFPKSTVHVAHCSSALHWLSRIPNQLADRNSPAFNRGRISHTGTEKAIEAYSGQFRKDMENFLNARALELVNGGMMIVLTLLLPDGVLYSETTLGMGYEIFGSCLSDMAKTGRVCAERVDSFNLPIYSASVGELKELIGVNGYFQIVRIEKLDYPMGDEKNRDPRLCARHFRAVIEGVVEDHFGKEIVEELFDRLTKKLEGNIFIFDEKYRQEAQYLVFLRSRVTG